MYSCGYWDCVHKAFSFTLLGVDCRSQQANTLCGAISTTLTSNIRRLCDLFLQMSSSVTEPLLVHFLAYRVTVSAHMICCLRSVKRDIRAALRKFIILGFVEFFFFFFCHFHQPFQKQ